MTFLPIVERELRVASRRKSTYRFRSLAATSALVLGGFYLMMFGELSRSRSVGQILFTTLSWILFVLCLCAGVLLGADSISEERREGTLGLLFLTDLKGFDVVLGKFIGASLNAFYSLFAAIPVLALPIMIGGVTGGEYWRMLLALTNALFFAFAISIFVSARCSESGKVLGWASALLAMSVVALPGVAATFPNLPKFLGYICTTSPLYPFICGSAARYLSRSDQYWTSLGLSHLLGWCLIFWTCFAISRTITLRTGSKGTDFMRNSGLGKIFRHLSRRDRSLLHPNPVVWLLDAPVTRRMLMFLAIAFVAVLVITAALGFKEELAFGGAAAFYLLILGLKPLVAAQACRFFANSRRDGTWELLRSSPLADDKFLNGQWSALIRTFWPPVAIMFVAELVMMGFAAKEGGVGVIYVLYTAFKAFTGFYAVSWFAIWMSLTNRTPMRALGTTILFSIALPTALFCIPDVISDAILIALGSTRARNLQSKVIGVRHAEIILPRQYDL
jgi:ABC-type transport system involved in multi-copper enzyme maturation permease subunit